MAVSRTAQAATTACRVKPAWSNRSASPNARRMSSSEGSLASLLSGIIWTSDPSTMMSNLQPGCFSVISAYLGTSRSASRSDWLFLADTRTLRSPRVAMISILKSLAKSGRSSAGPDNDFVSLGSIPVGYLAEALFDIHGITSEELGHAAKFAFPFGVLCWFEIGGPRTANSRCMAIFVIRAPCH